ncbi:MAG: DNA mismatch repair protein MutS, partial [Firmicutes bacterium]|nr:DNA mismatch repair protein MutS [Bacillota bacterium]
LCIFENKTGFGLSACDITTGEYVVTEFGTDGFNKVIDEAAKFSPSEIICSGGFGEEHRKRIENIFNVRPEVFDDYHFDLQTADILLCNQFKTLNLYGFGLEGKNCAVSAAGALLAYIKDAQRNGMENIRTLKYYERSNGMVLDVSARRHLELTSTLRDAKAKRGTLLWVLDDTKTAMGARLMVNRIEQPLTSIPEINYRLDGVEKMKENGFARNELRGYLKGIYDMERIMGRAVYGNAAAKDFLALRASLALLPDIESVLQGFDCEFAHSLLHDWNDLSDIHTLLCESLIEEPKDGVVKEEGIIRPGYDAEIDRLRSAMSDGSNWLLKMENEEKEKTGIKTLRIRYNRVHGYYIEVSNSYLDQVPDTYIRRQTLTTGERFINPKLKELEETLLSADEKLKEREQTVFAEVKKAVTEQYKEIMRMAGLVAEADFIQSLACAADKFNYARPQMTENKDIIIKNGRHPVVEQQENCRYIPNDSLINGTENMVSIITGPNMAGKSTYMRQVALIVLMAQIGSFVPADSAEIGVADRIFTRVGASDDLASGQSTFMVEMVEVANILNNASERSLLVLDEVGRGTSTFDGMSIAWAVIEYIAKKIKARTLFSTHYQELTDLAERTDSVKNYCVSVMEQGDDVVFLRKIKEGVVDKSYGVHVAKLAGVPAAVVERADEVLNILGDSGITMMTDSKGNYIEQSAMDASMKKTENEAQILDHIKSMNLDDISPREAWDILYSMKTTLN